MSEPIWLFFDFDNTLMGTEQYVLPSLIARFNELYSDQIGHLLTMQEFHAHFHGQAREALCHSMSKHFGIDVQFPVLFKDREWNLMQHMQKLPDGIPMAENLLETMQHVQEKHDAHFAIVTNSPLQRILTSMRFSDTRTGQKLIQFFGYNLFEVGDMHKPAPDGYLRAMQMVGADAKHSFAVEDSITGATASTKAGLVTFGFTGFAENKDEMAQKLLAQGCVATFDNWARFEALLEKEIAKL